MFDKLRSKNKDNMPKSRSSSSGSDIVRPRDIPTVIGPRPSTDSEPLPQEHPRSISERSSYGRRASTPGGQTSRRRSRGERSSEISQAQLQRPSKRRRLRDIFWKNGLWDEKGQYPEGPRVRAMSQSVDLQHPEVVEERMRAMYPQWRA